MTSPKKSLELRYLMLFTQKMVDLQLHQAVHQERPDFVWNQSGGVLGLEVTRLFKHSPPGHTPEQIRESEQSSIIRLARQLYEARGLPNLDLRMIFADAYLDKSQRRFLAVKIAEAIESYLPDPGHALALENDSGNDPLIPQEISYLSVARIEGLETNHWSASHAGWMQKDFREELQRRIDKKNKELPNYLKKCSRCWLLLVADGDAPSSFFDPGVDTLDHIYDSRFDRTFFLEALAGNVYELKTAYNKTANCCSRTGVGSLQHDRH